MSTTPWMSAGKLSLFSLAMKKNSVFSLYCTETLSVFEELKLEFVCDTDTHVSLCRTEADFSLCDTDTHVSLCRTEADFSLCDTDTYVSLCRTEADFSLCDTDTHVSLCRTGADFSLCDTDTHVSLCRTEADFRLCGGETHVIPNIPQAIQIPACLLIEQSIQALSP